MQLPLSTTEQTPTLNACVIPHALRHGAIHGALGSRGVGESMILIAPHNPIPLLNEVAAREETYEITYLQEGPQDWHIHHPDGLNGPSMRLERFFNTVPHCFDHPEDISGTAERTRGVDDKAGLATQMTQPNDGPTQACLGGMF